MQQNMIIAPLCYRFLSDFMKMIEFGEIFILFKACEILGMDPEIETSGGNNCYVRSIYTVHNYNDNI
jgi:hypothetical protein